MSAFNSVDCRLIGMVREMPKLENKKAIEDILVRKGEVPHMLFTGLHPQMLDLGAQKSINQQMVIMQNLEGCVTAMKPTGTSFDKLRIYVLLSSNKYMCLRVSSPNF